MRLLSDDDPNNAAQAEKVFDAFLLEPANQNFVLSDLLIPVIEQRIKDPMLRAIVLETLQAGLKEGATELAEVQVFGNQAVVLELEAAKVKAEKAA